MVLGKTALVLMLMFSGCTNVREITVTRLDGTLCRVTKTNPAWWSSETWTECMDKDGKLAVIPTNHDDVGILAGVIAAGLGFAAGAS